MEDQYDREANWIAESCASNAAYALEATNALWAALEKLDKGDTHINAEIRTAITGMSYLVGSTERLKGYFDQTSPSTTAETITPKPSKEGIGKKLLRGITGIE